MSSSKRIRGVIRWRVTGINTISPYYDTYANTRSDIKKKTDENNAIRAFLNTFNGGEGDDRNQLIIKGDPLINIDSIPTSTQKIYEIVLKECVFDDEFNIRAINCAYLNFNNCKRLNRLDGVNTNIIKLNMEHSYTPSVDLRLFPNLQGLRIKNSPDVNYNPRAVELIGGGNNVEIIILHRCKLTTLDLTQFPKLTTISLLNCEIDLLVVNNDKLGLILLHSTIFKNDVEFKLIAQQFQIETANIKEDIPKILNDSLIKRMAERIYLIKKPPMIKIEWPSVLTEEFISFITKFKRLVALQYYKTTNKTTDVDKLIKVKYIGIDGFMVLTPDELHKKYQLQNKFTQEEEGDICSLQ